MRKLLAILAISCSQASELRAQPSPSYAIACRIEFTQDPAFTDRLAGTVERHVRKLFNTVLGPEGSLRFLGPEGTGSFLIWSIVKLDSVALVSYCAGAVRVVMGE